jgi:hypothetical protein
MPRRRTLDEIVEGIEHARPVHPLRVLIAHHFYLDGWVSAEGGLALAMFNALLFVPFIFSLFFYPVQALIGLGILLVSMLVVYEGFLIWRRYGRRRPSTEDAVVDADAVRADLTVGPYTEPEPAVMQIVGTMTAPEPPRTVVRQPDVARVERRVGPPDRRRHGTSRFSDD